MSPFGHENLYTVKTNSKKQIEQKQKKERGLLTIQIYYYSYT